MSLLLSMVENALLMSGLIAVALLLRRFFGQRVRPACCYAIGIILAIGLLIPFRPALPHALVELPAWQYETAADGAAAQDAAARAWTEGAITTALTEDMDAADPVPALPGASPAPAGRGFSYLAAAGILWGAGILACATLRVLRQVRFRRDLRRWHSAPTLADQHAYLRVCDAMRVPRAPRLWRCEIVHSPMLIGLLHPIIVLPDQSFSDEELEIILQHELVHLYRHDLWYKALMLAAVCLHWFNPLVHRMARAVSADCEMSCDDIVLANADLSQRRLYGETILAVIARQQRSCAALSTYFYEGRNDVKRRFASMLDSRPRRTGSLLVIIALLLTVLTGSVLAEAVQAKSQTTGLPTDQPYRPMLLQVSNSVEARPILGLSEADVVYEAIIWGPMHTRYLALYNDHLINGVSSLRGARVYSISLAQAWDSIFISFGGQDSTGTSIYTYMDDTNFMRSRHIDGTRGNANVFYRLESRINPHNAAVNLELVLETAWPRNVDGTNFEPRDSGMAFSDKPSKGSEAIDHISVIYDSTDYAAAFDYNEALGLYERSYCGEPEIDGLTDKRIVASNVIVQAHEYSYYEGSMARPVVQMTEGGDMMAFIDGTMIKGTWVRDAIEDPITYLDEDGREIVFKPGKTFVQMITTKMYARSDFTQDGAVTFTRVPD